RPRFSPVNISCMAPHCLRLLWHEARLAASRARARAGNRMAARIPMMAITTSSSSKVKRLVCTTRISLTLPDPYFYFGRLAQKDYVRACRRPREGFLRRPSVAATIVPNASAGPFSGARRCPRRKEKASMTKALTWVIVLVLAILGLFALVPSEEVRVFMGPVLMWAFAGLYVLAGLILLIAPGVIR